MSKIKKLLWKKVTTELGHQEIWYTGDNGGFVAEITRVGGKSWGLEWPYRLTVNGKYLGDFMHLQRAKDYTATEFEIWEKERGQ